MDSRMLEHPRAQYGMAGVGFPYHLSHQHRHIYDLTGHQMQTVAPFSIDGLLNGSCSASVVSSSPLLATGCAVNADSQAYKLTGESTVWF